MEESKLFKRMYELFGEDSDTESDIALLRKAAKPFLSYPKGIKNESNKKTSEVTKKDTRKIQEKKRRRSSLMFELFGEDSDSEPEANKRYKGSYKITLTPAREREQVPNPAATGINLENAEERYHGPEEASY